MQGVYKVYQVGDKFQVFYCPSAPLHYNDKFPYDGRLYTKRQAAYRRCKQLNEQLQGEHSQEQRHVEAA